MRVRIAASSVALAVLLLASFPEAQGTPPTTPLTLVSREGRRVVPTVVVSTQEFIALDDVVSLFQVSVREDALAGGVTVSYRGRTIVASPDQPMVSVSGRVVALPAPIMRAGRRWLVPLEFLSRALAPLYEQRIDLRRPSRLLIVGDLRVPRVTARIDAPGPPTRASIEIIPAAPVSSATENGRVVLRIEADALDLALPPAGAGLIEQIRAGDQPGTVAVVLAATAGTPRVSSTVAETSTRVSVDVPLAGQAPVEAAAPPPPVTSPPTVIPGAPRSVLETIVIDPGHGGDEVGVRGATGIEERHLTLDVARRLRGLIETRLGIRVVLTRDDDRTVGLDQRAAIANNSKADLFISLHANAALSAAVAGAEVYHIRLDREGEAVRRQAAADAVSLPVLGGGSRTLEVIRWDLAQARHVEASAQLAAMLAQDLGERVPLSPRGVQRAALRVLEGADMPAALVEMGYLSNGADEKRAASEEHKNAVAQGLYTAITRFRTYLEQQAR